MNIKQAVWLLFHMGYTCKDCAKAYTRFCPIRVWGRNEGNVGLDVKPDDDFCSRFATKMKWGEDERFR